MRARDRNTVPSISAEPMRFFMLATRRLVAVGAVFAIVASAIAFAQTMPDHHPMGADQHQMMQSGQHPMGRAKCRR
jgi:hypothetical protein